MRSRGYLWEKRHGLRVDEGQQEICDTITRICGGFGDEYWVERDRSAEFSVGVFQGDRRRRLAWDCRAWRWRSGRYIPR